MIDPGLARPGLRNPFRYPKKTAPAFYWSDEGFAYAIAVKAESPVPIAGNDQ